MKIATAHQERRHLLMQGPLTGLKVVKFAGLGPPLTAMLLADLGADVIRLERPDPTVVGFTYLTGPTVGDTFE